MMVISCVSVIDYSNALGRASYDWWFTNVWFLFFISLRKYLWCLK